jgi:5-methylcytosine-specific restriction protein A
LGKIAMPRRPNIPCKHPGCNRLIPPEKKYCDEHIVLHSSNIRSTNEKGYDGRWKKARVEYLKRNPLCVRCLAKGKYKKATVVDHIVPHRGDKSLFWNESNWQALCKTCHDRKTMTEDKYEEYKY